MIDTENLPEGDEKVRAVRQLFDTVAPRYDLVNRLMTFRLDVRWRRLTVEQLRVVPGGRILDLACGTGDFCRDLESAGFRVVGVDLSAGMLAAARTDAPLVHADILRLPVSDASVDGATCGFALRNLAKLGPFFDELARAVRPGGRIGLLDVAEPENRVLRLGHSIYFGKVVPRIGALLSDANAYRYLPKSVEYLPERAVMLDRLAEAGFVDIEHRLLAPGSVQLMTATRA